jgi:uncharacterized linocin/CFP29 family protein
LRRELAPISTEAWNEVDAEATRALKTYLAARRLVDFDGPHGWEAACMPTGRLEPIGSSGDVTLAARKVRPFVEVRSQFALARAELDALERGAGDADLSAVVDAARRAAAAEDALVFDGNDEAGVTGIGSGSPHDALTIGDDYSDFPGLVAQAVAALRTAGVDGPYGVALGPRCYTGVIETTERGGYPVLQHLQLITGGPVVWAPAVDGSLVVSMRGGDYQLSVGEDLSIGYLDHDADSVTLYIEETLTFSNHTPEAAVALRY